MKEMEKVEMSFNDYTELIRRLAILDTIEDLIASGKSYCSYEITALIDLDARRKEKANEG